MGLSLFASWRLGVLASQFQAVLLLVVMVMGVQCALFERIHFATTDHKEMVLAKTRDSFSSLIPLRVDCLVALEHLDESLDLIPPCGPGLHGVDPEGQREPVLRGEFLEHQLGLRPGIDGGLEIIGDPYAFAAAIKFLAARASKPSTTPNREAP